MKKILIPIIVILVIVAGFLIRDYVKFRPVDWEEGEVKLYKVVFPDDPAYEMALSSVNGRAVFKDPFAAMKQFQSDYKSLIEQTQEEFDLNNFTRYTYKTYCLYASGVPRIIISFCNVFENSFERTS